MDLLAAFADRGALTDPAQENWSDPANYDEMTRDLDRLGMLMGTSASGTGDGFSDGIDSWVDASQTDSADLVQDSINPPDWSSDPGFAQTAGLQQLKAIADTQAMGGLATAGVVFLRNATPLGGDPSVDFHPPKDTGNQGGFRSRAAFAYGGHVVAVTGVSVGHGRATLSIHDPATPFDFGLGQQTPYVTQTYPLRFEQLTEWGPAGDNPYTSKIAGNGKGSVLSDIATMELHGYLVNGVVNPNLNEATAVDGFTTITPTSVAFRQSASSIGFISDPGTRLHESVFHVPGGVAHLAIDAADPALIYYSAAGSSKIRVYDVLLHTARVLASVGAPILQLVPGGRQDGVFARTAHAVVSFDALGHRVGTVRGSFSTIAVDGADESLLATSRSHSRLLVYSPALKLVSSSLLPASLGTRGVLRFSVDPGAGQLLFTGSSGVTYRAPLRSSASAHASAVGVPRVPRHLHPVRFKLAAADIVAENGAGKLFVLNGGHLRTYRTNGKRAPGPYDGFRVHGEVAVTQAYHYVPRSSASLLRQ
jgi:hypothetical protein